MNLANEILSEPEQLRRFREGRCDALTCVYFAYAGKVKRIIESGFAVRQRLVRVGGAHRYPEDVSDLVQETFLRAFSDKARLAYDSSRSYSSYLFAIARNVLADWARWQGHRRHEPAAPVDALVERCDLEPWLDPFLVDLTVSYVELLPTQLRAVYRARFAEGRSQQNAAVALGISRQTLRTLEGRLLDGLAHELEAKRMFNVDCEQSRQPIFRSARNEL